MQHYFRHILVPVDFSSKTEGKLQTAITLADPARSYIHLLHVASPRFPLFSFRTHPQQDALLGLGAGNFVKILIRLANLKSLIETWRRTAIVKVHVVSSRHRSEEIGRVAKRLGIQVVVLSKSAKQLC